MLLYSRYFSLKLDCVIQYKRIEPGTSNVSLVSPSLLQGKNGFREIPLVSAIMITRGDLVKVSRALRMFENQTWPNKEIIIVSDKNHGEIKALVSGKSFFCKQIEVNENSTLLGDLRNMGIAACNGDFVCQWDDDDLYHPSRMGVMMSAINESSADAAFLDQWLMYWIARQELALANKRVWEGSMLIKRSSAVIYPSMSRSEDSEMVNFIMKSRPIALVHAPGLYVYCVTGQNTWSESHMERLFSSAEKHLNPIEIKKIVATNDAFKEVRNIPGFLPD